MKIHQIIQEAPFTDEQEAKFLNSMNDEDWHSSVKWRDNIQDIRPDIHKIGGGAYANVFGTDKDDTVLKIAGNDKGAIAYISWCIRNQKNPHVPKILKMVKSPNKTFLYVRMERLKMPTGKILTLETIPALMYVASRFDERCIDLDVIRQFIYPALMSIYYIPYHDVGKYEDAERWNKQEVLNNILLNNPSVLSKLQKEWSKDPLTQVFRFVNKARKSTKVFKDFRISAEGYDMHNIMQRPSTGELVVTDPLAGR